MKLRSAFAVLVVLAVPSLGEYARTVSYKGDVVVRCPDRTKATVDVLRKHADVFRVGADKSIDLRVTEKSFESVARYFPECEVVIQDLEDHVRAAEERMASTKVKLQSWAKQVMEEMVSEQGVTDHDEALAKVEAKLAKDTWFEDYHDYAAIVQWYKNKAAEYSNLVTFVPSIGTTGEGRDMPAVHITASTKGKATKKIYLQSLIHAREWITGAALMYTVDHLLTNYGNDAEVTKILDNVEIVAVPIVNPDGYSYTWSNDRLWRKNRVINAGSDCMGVDINRNFPTGWDLEHEGMDVAGASTNPCREDYRGAAQGSELEAQHIMAYFKLNAPIVGAVDMHSYGQLILRPWGWTKTYSADESKLNALGEKLVEAMKESTGKVYTSQPSYDLYQANGIASDWFYSKEAAVQNSGIRAMGYTIELRDNGNSGFLLPASEIVSTGKEFVAALKTFAKYVASNPIYLQSSHTSSNQ